MKARSIRLAALAASALLSSGCTLSGTVVIEILDSIAPGLPRDEFFQRVQDQIESASSRLLEEGRKELGFGPAPASEASLSKAG